jgi:hypothetical protein
MKPIGWLFLAAVSAPALCLAVFYARLFRDPKLAWERNVRLFIIVRATELVLFIVILATAPVTTKWVLVAEVLPLVVLPLWRGRLKRRELSAGH